MGRNVSERLKCRNDLSYLYCKIERILGQ